MSPAIFERADYHFLHALALIARSGTASAAVIASSTAISSPPTSASSRRGPETSPENFAHRAALVSAEIARLDGRELDAERQYEQAIGSAQAPMASSTMKRSLTNWRRASMTRRGFVTIARAYLQNARYCYTRWGADGKVRQLGEIYPHLREEERTPSSTSTIGAQVEQLDLATVIKVSQAVSREIVVEKLIDSRHAHRRSSRRAPSAAC